MRDTLGVRLKEVRESLDLTQDAFAVLAGVGRRTVIDWETGKTAPKGFQFSALSEAGVDVLYLLTGRREESCLAPDEAALLDDYRRSPEVGKRAIRGAASASAQAEAGERENGTAIGANIDGISGKTAQQNLKKSGSIKKCAENRRDQPEDDLLNEDRARKKS